MSGGLAVHGTTTFIATGTSQAVYFYASDGATLAARILVNSPGDLEIAHSSGSGLDSTIYLASSGITLAGATEIAGNIGFYSHTPVAKATVTGSKGGNAALASLLVALSGMGLVTDSTT